jgi:predicted DNA-binding transcriptional regulator AlpA
MQHAESDPPREPRSSKRTAASPPAGNVSRKGKNRPADEARRARLAEADPWLNKKEVIAYRNVSDATLDRQIARGQFPRGELITGRTRGWRLSVVKAALPAGAVPPQERPNADGP